MRYFMILFLALILINCSTNSVTKSETEGLNQKHADSILQMLATSAAKDFHLHGPYPACFRNVYFGRIVSNGNEWYLLCGEFQPMTDGQHAEWVPFVTIKTSDYEQWIGQQSLAFSQNKALILNRNKDLSAFLQNQLDLLK